MLFYGAGCRQCNKLAPEWKSLADTINKNKESDSKDRTNPEQEIITNENPGILIAKANCSIENSKGEKPIHLARSSAVALHLKTLSDESDIVFRLAAKEHHTELLTEYASRVDINSHGEEGKSALHWAVQGDETDEAKDLETVRYLISKGAVIDQVESHSNTVLLSIWLLCRTSWSW